MNPCEQLESVGAYHDGELAGAARQALEAHLQTCPQCAAELGELQALSRWLVAARTAMPALAPAALARMHEAIERSQPVYDLIPLARHLAAVAAAILVVCSLWMATRWAEPAPAPSADSPLDAAAMTILSDPTNTPSTPETQLYQFISRDLGGTHD